MEKQQQEEEKENTPATTEESQFVGFKDGAFCAADMCSLCAAKGYRRPLLPLALAYHRLPQEEIEKIAQTKHATVSVRECTICGARAVVEPSV